MCARASVNGERYRKDIIRCPPTQQAPINLSEGKSVKQKSRGDCGGSGELSLSLCLFACECKCVCARGEG